MFTVCPVHCNPVITVQRTHVRYGDKRIVSGDPHHAFNALKSVIYFRPIFIIEQVQDVTEIVSQHCIHVPKSGYQSLHHAQSETGGLLH
jgi:hypothetical protein